MNLKSRLLICLEWFTPGYRAGGPIQSCYNLCAALQHEKDIFVFTTDTDHGETAPYPDIETGRWVQHPELNIQVYYAKRSQLRQEELLAQIRFVQPDVLYLNLMFSPLFVLYPLWLRWRNRITARVVICPRGSLYSSALMVRSWKKWPVLQLMRWMGLARVVHFHATNERERQAVLRLFPRAQITVADNLPGMNQAPFVPVMKTPGAVSCIFIARIVPIKNLLYLLEVLKGVTAEVTLTIVGPAEDTVYWNRCLAYIRQLPPRVQVRYEGAQPSVVLQPMLQRHHLFVLPTRGENFGHAIFEALKAGRPVLVSDQTPWLQLTSGKAGWDLSLQAPSAFREVIETVAAMDQQAYDVWAKGAWQYAVEYIQNNPNRQRYLNLFS